MGEGKEAGGTGAREELFAGAGRAGPGRTGPRASRPGGRPGGVVGRRWANIAKNGFHLIHFLNV